VDRNFFLAFALSFLVLTFWAMWQGEQTPSVPQGTPEIAEQPVTPPPAPPPSKESLVESDRYDVEPPADPGPDSTPEAKTAQISARTVEIVTPLFKAELTTLGAGLTSWKLDQYRDAEQPGDLEVDLVTLGPGHAALVTPLRELGLGDLSQVVFDMERPGALDVVFSYAAHGVSIRKSYSFDEESYTFQMRLAVENESGGVVEPEFGVVWPARVQTSNDFANHAFVALADGSVEQVPVPSIGSPSFFSRLMGGGSGDGPIRYDGEVDWAGVQSRYFLSVLLPDAPRDAGVVFEATQPSESGEVILGFPSVRLAPGQDLEREYRGYVGPKEAERLEAVGAQLDRSIDRGWAWVAPLTAAFSWMLRAIYDVIPNYGVAIILITLMVRLATAPLMAKQMKSMRRMGELQPKMKELQQKHADDKQKQSEELMKLYKQSGVNPLGGCFPMLLQLPVFIGLYYALQSTIELRQEPFFGWINDLSAPETLFVIPGLDLPIRVLPLLMGASMVLQQKMTPTTIDPAQARMMMTVMPIMFTVLFYQFPSGLVLYWLVSNLLGIGHQLWVNRGMQRQKPAPRSSIKQEKPVGSG
jgi:YidC/Oxa1 family membrane protein insertase